MTTGTIIGAENEEVVETPATETPANDGNRNAEVTDWRAGLDESLRGEKVFETIKGKDWNEAGPLLAKGYLEGQRYAGQSIKLPGKDAKPEEIAAVRDKLVKHGLIEGPPESPDKYEITGDDVVPAEAAKGFALEAHKLGLTQKQMAGVLDYYKRTLGEGQAELAQSRKQVEDELQKEWGPAGFKKNVTLARRAVLEVGGKELLEKLETTGLGNDPVLVKMFARVGALLAEEGSIAGDVPGVPGAEDAKAEIARIQNDPNDLYHGRHAGKPGHDERVKYVRNLYKIAYPEK